MLEQLVGLLSDANMISLVDDTVKQRFVNPASFKAPEILVLHEMSLVEDDSLKRLSEEILGMELESLRLDYIPDDIRLNYEDTNYVPIRYSPTEHRVHVVTLPEINDDKYTNYMGYETVVHYVPIYDYVRFHTTLYGRPKFLLELAVADLLDYIVKEATKLGASDLTISTAKHGVNVYYDVRKRKVFSKIILTKEDLHKLITIITTRAKSVVVEGDIAPKYMGLDLDEHHRGRAVLNSNFWGRYLSCRIFNNDFFELSLEDLNLDKRTCRFLRKVFNDMEPGLRVMIGRTSSGKNSTQLSTLKEMVDSKKYKIVSVEQPVEQLVEGIEQLPATSKNHYSEVVASLIRQNPDIVYPTEITELTAYDILKIANTGVPVYTTVHADSIADLPSRLVDLTGLSVDRVMEHIHAAVYQMLKRDDKRDRLYPVTTCLEFTQEIKDECRGRPLHEVTALLREYEKRWIYNVI